MLSVPNKAEKNSSSQLDNFTKYKITDMDEDYIAEDQIDLNKYNYLYNYNQNEEDYYNNENEADLEE